MPTRIIIADGRKLLREGLCQLLRQHSDLEVVGEAAELSAAPRLAAAMGADVVVLIVSGAGPAVTAATRELLETPEPPRVLVYASHAEPEAVRHLFAAGVSGCVTKDCDGEELVTAIRLLYRGRTYVGNHLADELLSRLVRPGGTAVASAKGAGGAGEARQPEKPRLSEQERNTVARLADGQSTREIALALGVSGKTVETYRRRAMEKLGCTNLAQLVKCALREGLTTV